MELLDLSAGVDVYSDWIDACDAVAKDGTDPADGNEIDSYHDIEAGIGRRNSQIHIDRHLVSAIEDNDDTQGDSNEN